ncbi:hypothetical protein CROQUDRAFT_223632 [Cronartium quercuum f. sp. fusiforme G11]|uniref:Uncharacterized protein n=1 Tax=Cronartium quercuum f. sp. fusiforme G11 TaxID=708437 RepID=A0A9P6N9S8_9BASI|nr:hypothetical protein CROQUDRAFT_223632 [Cronartium quercuum f. sp. fusiforme G11]
MESSNQQPAVPSSFSGTSHSHPFTTPHQHVAQPQCKCLEDPDQPSQKHFTPLPSSPSSTHYTKPICRYSSPWRLISVNQFFSTSSSLDLSLNFNLS